MGYAIGIDLGGTNIKVVSVTADGTPLSRASVPTEDAAEVDWAERIREQIRRVEAEQGGPADRIGLSAPGLPASDGRRIAWMQGRMEAVQGLDWTTYLGMARTIPVLNDAQAALRGEAWIGAARGCRNVILLTLGTGVGGAVMVDGHLLRGHIGRA